MFFTSSFGRYCLRVGRRRRVSRYGSARIIFYCVHIFIHKKGFAICSVFKFRTRNLYELSATGQEERRFVVFAARPARKTPETSTRVREPPNVGGERNRFRPNYGRSRASPASSAPFTSAPRKSNVFLRSSSSYKTRARSCTRGLFFFGFFFPSIPSLAKNLSVLL